MDIKNMHEMIEKLVACTKAEFDKKGIEKIDAEEMGKVTDIIKDLAEAQYYRTLVVAMDESEYGEDYDENGPMEEERRYYRGQRRNARTGRYMRRGYDEMLPIDYHEIGRMRDMDMGMNRMYYSDGGGNTGGRGGMSGGNSRGYGGNMYYGGQGNGRDYREGRSGQSRRSYMEAKEMHSGNTPEDKQHKIKELEKYMEELSNDVTEMINGASPEEKNTLKAKMQALIGKIN